MAAEKTTTIAPKFNRYTYTITVEVDDDTYLDGSPFPKHSEAKDALRSEITSNLESLDGIRSVTVEPVG